MPLSRQTGHANKSMPACGRFRVLSLGRGFGVALRLSGPVPPGIFSSTLASRGPTPAWPDSWPQNPERILQASTWNPARLTRCFHHRVIGAVAKRIGLVSPPTEPRLRAAKLPWAQDASRRPSRPCSHAHRPGAHQNAGGVTGVN